MIRAARNLRPATALRLARRTMFIQTEPTPNPDSLKFLPGKAVLDSGTRDFSNFREAQASPLAKKLMQVDGVRGVFFSTEFVTVSKEEAAEWPTLKPLVFAEIMDFYASGDAIIGEEGEAADSLAIAAAGKTSGGFLGFGEKKLDESQRAQLAKAAYAKGISAIDKFIMIGNDGLGMQFAPLDTIQ